jgi:hypothetical protein
MRGRRPDPLNLFPGDEPVLRGIARSDSQQFPATCE